MAAGLEPCRLFPGQLPNLDRFRVEAGFYMNRCTTAMATPANAGFKSPHDMYYRHLPPANTIVFMQPGLRHISRLHKLDAKAEIRFYLNQGRSCTRDYIKVHLLRGYQLAGHHMGGRDNIDHRDCAACGSSTHAGNSTEH